MTEVSIGDPERNELEFLRYFYENVEPVLGPASDDIYYDIKEEWVANGNTLPEKYCDLE